MYVHLSLILDNCQIPTLNRLVEIEVINSTVQLEGSELTLRCSEGFTPTRPQLGTLFCTSNGTWIPDPDDYECQSKKGIVILLRSHI